MIPTLKQLQYLVALDDTRHFRRAAERCGISQPSLSVQIANLERALNIQLVGRGRGPVTATAAGREVIDRARRILQETRDLTEIAQRLGTGLSGTVRLGASSTLGPYFLPHVVGRLHRDHPDLKLYIREAAPRRLIEDLDRGEHDLVLTQLPAPGPDYGVARLFREPLLLTVARDHPLANRETVTEADLAGLSVLSLGAGYVLHEQVRALCTTHGAHLLNDYEGTSLDALRAMTGMGMGATLLPALYVASEITRRNDAVCALRFAGDRVARSMGLVTRRKGGNDRSFARLTEIFRAIARSQKSSGLRVET